MDLAIGRKPDYRPVGYMAHAEGRKSIKQTPSNKVRVISRGQGRGTGSRIGFASAIKEATAVAQNVEKGAFTP